MPQLVLMTSNIPNTLRVLVAETSAVLLVSSQSYEIRILFYQEISSSKKRRSIQNGSVSTVCKKCVECSLHI